MEESSTLRAAKEPLPEEIQVGFVEEHASSSSPLPSIDEVGSPFAYTSFPAYQQMSIPLLPAHMLGWHEEMVSLKHLDTLVFRTGVIKHWTLW